MADITEKADGQMSKPSGVRAPGESGANLAGPKPVLDNRWGASLAKGQSSLQINGGGKKK